MRALGLVLLVATVLGGTASAKPSNPAFLGIAMRDVGAAPSVTTAPTGPCAVETVTRGSGAEQAGLQAGDILLTMDGAAIVNCDALLKVVQGHQPGDDVKLAILRCGALPWQMCTAGGRRAITVGAQLISRDEILRRRHVGQAIAPTELIGVDDEGRIDLSERGKTTIVGWYDVRRCADCAAVFTRIAAWSRGQADKRQPVVLAVTRGEPYLDRVEYEKELKLLRSVMLDVPLAIADAGVYENYTIADPERVNLMVVDCRGVVQYVSPVAPNSDDTDAVLDELFAAAAQATRRVK